MSKGHGKVEAAILDVLTANAGDKFSSLELAVVIYEIAPDAQGRLLVSAAQAAAVRRALANLKRQGKVFNLGRFHDNGKALGMPQTRWASRETAEVFVRRNLAAFGPKYVDKDLVEALGLGKRPEPSP